jgi:hypothetical protein
MKVAFPDAPITFDFDVTEGKPDEKVAWRLAGPPEWAKTDVSFRIETDEEESRSVLFWHDGWATTDESFPFIAYSWAQILPRLKTLAETGTREPFFRFRDDLTAGPVRASHPVLRSEAAASAEPADHQAQGPLMPVGGS